MLCSKLLALAFISVVRCKMHPFVIGGNAVKINEYPHSVYLNIYCEESFICSGSILNQRVVLTAGHCVAECEGKNGVQIRYGHEVVTMMKTTSMSDFILHEDYEEDRCSNDVALVLTEEALELGKRAKRVIVLNSPPTKIKKAKTAGWGIINANSETISMKLFGTTQILQPNSVCRLMGRLPKGSFCAGPVSGTGTPGIGDSGSALMVGKCIQIGIVSYKVKDLSLVVYTNVSHHYSWIKLNTHTLLCRRQND